MITLKVFVVDLEKYNSGKVSGEWFDMSYNDREEVLKKLFGVDEDGYAIEKDFAIHAYEVDTPLNSILDEHTNLDNIHELARFLDRLTIDEYHLFLAIVEAAYSRDIDTLIGYFKNGDYTWYPEYDDLADVGEEYYREMNGESSLPEHMWYYVDFERWAQDNTGFVRTTYGYIELMEG